MLLGTVGLTRALWLTAPASAALGWAALPSAKYLVKNHDFRFRETMPSQLLNLLKPCETLQNYKFRNLAKYRNTAKPNVQKLAKAKHFCEDILRILGKVHAFLFRESFIILAKTPKP